MYHARHIVMAGILCFASECFCISINNPYFFKGGLLCVKN